MKALAKLVKGHSLWADAIRRMLRDNAAVFSFLIMLVYVIVAVLVKFGFIAADWAEEIGPSRGAPVWGADWRLWLGTDIFGRSVTAKVLQGAYTALYVGLATCLISIPIGLFFGLLAGYFGGIIDDFITWFYTMLSNIPEILLIVAIAFSMGKGLNSVVIALGVTTWVSLARLVRGEVIKHRAREYVAAAESLGAGHVRRIFVHILPNIMHIVIITFSLRFVTAIKSEVVLTYLGLGAQTGVPSWGVMIDDAKGELIQGVWWGLTGATIGMFVVVLAFSLFGDSLRDAFDPKLKT